MKIVKTLCKTILGSSMAFALATALLGIGCATTDTSSSQMKPMKGGEHMMMMQGITTTEEVEALKPDDSMAMVCAKCQTVWVSRAKQGVKGGQMLMEGGQPKELIGTHACAGCNSTLTVVGAQKGAHTELKHSCKACGEGSAFCCATKHGGAMHEMEK